MRLRFSLDALRHIAAIRFYIGERSPRAAAHVVTRIFAEAARLAEFPEMGHVGIVPGTYEWRVPGLPHVIVHEIDDAAHQVVVLAAFHAAQARGPARPGAGS